MRKLRQRARALLACIAVASIGFSAVETVVAASGTLNDALQACIAIQADSERLACFDAAVAGLSTQRAPPPPPPPAAPTAEEAFGAKKVPPPPPPDAPPKPAPIDRIEAAVTEIARRPTGDLVVTLNNGQVWAQVPTGNTFRLKVGETVTISRGMLGSYTLSTEAKRSFKVTRLQ